MRKSRKIAIIVVMMALMVCSIVVSINANGTVKTASVDEATMTTLNPDGTSVTSSGTFDELMQTLNNANSADTKDKKFTIVINSDFTTKKYFELQNFDSSAKLSIDINGHTITSTTANVIQVRSSCELTIDGADDNGNLGTVISTGGGASFFYIRSTGNNFSTDNAVVRASNLNLVSTKLSSAGQPVLHLANGTTYLDNVNITYTGADWPSTAEIENKPIVKITKGSLYVNNCSLINTSNVGNTVYGIYAYNKTTASNIKAVSVTNSSIDADYGVYSVCANTEIRGSVINAAHTVYAGAGNFHITDTLTQDTGSGFSAVGSGSLHFYYGTGKNVIKLGKGNTINDKLTTEEGYTFINVANGEFLLEDLNTYPTVKLSSLFDNGMVFQRGSAMSVYGTCLKDGAEINVTLGTETKTATVVNGEWSVTFEAREAARGLTLSVDQVGSKLTPAVTYTDVSIGEVWVISGQSNAHYQTFKMEDAEEYIANADNFDNIMIFRNPSTYAFSDDQECVGSWHKVTSELLVKATSEIYGEVNAVAYVAATRLAAELGDDIAIAIVDASYNGSGISTWIDHERFVENFAEEQASAITAYEKYAEFIAQNGRMPTSASELAEYRTSPHFTIPSICYNTMIEPIKGFAAKGVIWYQGEQNISYKDNYINYFNVLKQTYREAFANDDLKFFVVQLAPYATNTSAFKAAQYKLSLEEDTYIITTSTEGTVFTSSDLAHSSASDGFIHPSRKSPIGHRIADSILKNVYGFYENEIVTAPNVVKIEAVGASVVITFDSELRTFFGSDPEDFEIAGADKVFVSAKATISGNTVTLTAEGIETAQYVRYGYSPMTLLLKDGTKIRYNKELSNSSTTANATIVDENGNIYVFEADADDVIFTYCGGNMTNESGHPMPTFMLEVGFGCEE